MFSLASERGGLLILGKGRGFRGAREGPGGPLTLPKEALRQSAGREGLALGKALCIWKQVSNEFDLHASFSNTHRCTQAHSQAHTAVGRGSRGEGQHLALFSGRHSKGAAYSVGPGWLMGSSSDISLGGCKGSRAGNLISGGTVWDGNLQKSSIRHRLV